MIIGMILKVEDSEKMEWQKVEIAQGRWREWVANSRLPTNLFGRLPLRLLHSAASFQQVPGKP